MENSSKSPRPHPIKRILQSKERGMIICKYGLIILIALVGLQNFLLSLKSLKPELVYKKDIIQEYLLAKAVLSGVDPYLPCPELAQRFVGSVPYNMVLHPTPHPPPVAVLSLPLALVSYPQAAIIWFILEFVGILIFCYLMIIWNSETNGLSTVLYVPLMIFVLLSWSPFLIELFYGNVSIPLMFLIAGGWQALRSGRNLQSGLLIGSAVAMKLFVWPIIVFLAVKRNWRSAGSAIGVLGMANFVAALLMGFDKVINYYLAIGPMIAQVHRVQGFNFSTWTIFSRLFSGIGSEVLLGVEAPPLVYMPNIVLFSFVLPAAFLIIGLTLAVKARSLDAAWGMLVCVCILISPVAWLQYLTLAVMPAIFALRCLSTRKWPLIECNAALVICVLLFFSGFFVNRGFYALIQGLPCSVAANFSIKVTFWQGLLPLVPAAALSGLLWLVWRLDKYCPMGNGNQ